MWKSQDKPGVAPSTPVTPSTPAMRDSSFNSPAPSPTRHAEPMRSDVAHIGKSVVIKGELSGSEDLYLDGEVEGSIQLHNHSLIVGPNGRIRANVFARDVVVHGKVDGNLNGTERVELKKSAILMGDISTARIVIEDGAYFKGAIDIKKDAKAEPRKAMAAAASYSDAPAAAAGQSTLLDQKN